MSNSQRSAGPNTATGGARGSGKPPMNPLVMGIVIGLLLGILLALGIALFLNRSASPFVEKTRPVDALPTIAPRTEAPKPDAVRQPEVATSPGKGKDGDKPRFEFYQLLPGEKAGASGAKKPADSAAGKAETGPSAPGGSVPAKPAAAAAAKDSYFLQAGAFQNESEAENMKAKIAFAGMEANVRSVNLADKGTLYRVRLGPYASIEEVNRAKATLSQNGINAAVVRSD
jgi:cell division protein FtsN